VGTTPIVDQVVAAGPTRITVRSGGEVVRDTQVTVAAGQRLTIRNLTLADAKQASSSSGGTASADAGEGQASPSSADRPSAATAGEDDAQSASGASSTSPEEQRASEGGDAVGRVAVSVEPRGTASVDGVGQTGTEPIRVEPGTHTLTCRHPTYGAISTSITVPAEQTISRECHFTRTVNVTTTQSWGSVWVDGEQRGQTHTELTLTPGTHEIAVKVRSRSETFSVGGGRLRTERGSDTNTESFEGASYTLDVEPTFESVSHALVFEISRD